MSCRAGGLGTRPPAWVLILHSTKLNKKLFECHLNYFFHKKHNTHKHRATHSNRWKSESASHSSPPRHRDLFPAFQKHTWQSNTYMCVDLSVNTIGSSPLYTHFCFFHFPSVTYFGDRTPHYICIVLFNITVLHHINIS